jgi:hypothetical protein
MSEIKLIQLNNYVKPVLQENKSKNWVLNGVNNSFYQYIIDRFNGSVTNHSIITAYTHLIYGQGLFAKNASSKPTEWANFKTILNSKDLRKIVSDFQLFGEASVQVIKSKDRKRVTGIFHLPKQYVVPSLENEEGEIEHYFYNKDWGKPKLAEQFSAFGTSNDESEIYCIKPYSAGKNYFTDPDYLPALQYANIEEEISNFYNNFLLNGLSAGYLINVPDGQTLTAEEKDSFERQIKAKLTGSPNAGKFVLNFASKDSEITITAFPVNESMHKQWEFLSNEARQQIMTGHFLTSPMLAGIKDNTGLGNNANELDEAESQLLKRVIAPKQFPIIEAIDEIISFNNMAFDFYFKPLSEVQDTAMPTQLSEEKKKSTLDEILDSLDSDLQGYDLVDSRKVEYEDEDELDKIIAGHNIQFASTGTANPNAKDTTTNPTQDGKLFKSRYRYSSGLNANSREFCSKMVGANKLYRKQDIDRMSKLAVNPGWGPKGVDNYDLFFYKGGGGCHHSWIRETYRLKSDVNSPLAEKITPAQARKEGEILPANDKLVYTAPKDMPFNGFLPSNKRFN